MGDHIDKNGQFQSDKYSWCQPDFVPLKVTDPMAQVRLWDYANAREAVDPVFAADLRARLIAVGFDPPRGLETVLIAGRSNPDGSYEAVEVCRPITAPRPRRDVPEVV